MIWSALEFWSRRNLVGISPWMKSGLQSFASKGCVKRLVFSPYKLSWAGDFSSPRRDSRKWLCGAHVLVQTDSTTVMHYLNRAGGTRSSCLDWKVREISHWCLSMRITLSAVVISGQDNMEADRLSRFRIENPRRLERFTKWSLDHRVTNLLFNIWGQPTVDLFPTRLNNKVETSFSRLPDPLALQATPCRQTGPWVYCTCIPHCPFCPLLFTRWSGRRLRS